MSDETNPMADSSMIEARDLTKRYRDIEAIRGVTFTLQKGEIVGLLGPNGAGKTTTMRILTGIRPATSGSAKVAGHDVFDEPMQVKRRIGYLPEVPPLYPDLTVREYLQFVATLKGVRGQKARTEIDRVSDRVGLGDVIDRLIRNISKGYRQRTGLAQALLGDPDLLILDEPTVGLDPRQIEQVRSLIKSLAGDHSVILSTHILQEVVATCDRAIIISRGRIVADGGIDALVAEHGTGDTPSLEQAFLSLTES